MIVVDTSALLAILFVEAEAESFARIIREQSVHQRVAITTPSLLEAHMVTVARYGETAAETIDEVCKKLGLGQVAFAAPCLSHARAAYLEYGKGRHPAGLNFGDCISYAAAKKFDAPLLFKGNDFSRTDIRSAVQYLDEETS